MCVCVCVCVAQRKRARRNLLYKSKLVERVLCVYIYIYIFFSLSPLAYPAGLLVHTQKARVPRVANSAPLVFFFAAAIRVSKFDGGNGVDVIGRELAAPILMKSQTRKRETKRFQRESEQKKKGGWTRRMDETSEREREREKEVERTRNV